MKVKSREKTVVDYSLKLSIPGMMALVKFTAGRPTSPQELADLLGKSPAQISRMLPRLERIGIIRPAKRTRWDQPRETSRGSKIKWMRKPRELTLEGGIWVLCQDIISQIEEGRDFDNLKLPSAFERWIEGRIEQRPRAFLNRVTKMRKALQAFESDLQAWVKMQGSEGL